MGSVQQLTVRRSGFSLIELLVVIAIIALLAAIIFPVFEQIKENSRQSTSISNMHDISTKLEQYNLDAHHYPPILFGYAVPNGPKSYASMDQALNTCTTQQTCSTYLTGLYPEYIDNVAEFHDPDDSSQVTGSAAASNPDGTTNPVGSGGDIVSLNHLFLCAGNDSTVTPNASGPCGATTSGDADDCACPQSMPTTTPTNPPATDNPLGTGVLVQASGYFKNNPTQPYALNAYYAADSYDVSPRIENGTTLDSELLAGTNDHAYNYLVRYQPSWTTISENLDCNTPVASGGIGSAQGLCSVAPDGTITNLYLNQVRWRNPPGSAYVTSTTWHVNGAGSTVLVLTADGAVQKYDANRFFGVEENNHGPATAPPNEFPLNMNSSMSPTVCDAKFWQVTHE